ADVGGSEARPLRMLAELLPTRDTPAVHTYFPLREYTGLFLAFAETPPTEEGILEFANKFGALGRASRFADGPEPPHDEQGRPTRPVGEPFELWRQQISDLQQAAELWRMCQESDVAGLANHIFWEPDPLGHDSVLYVSHQGHESGEITPSGYRA